MTANAVFWRDHAATRGGSEAGRHSLYDPPAMAMYSKIAVPVDLAHADQLDKALDAAADLAKLYGASVFLVAVTASAPTEVARNPDEFLQELTRFAQQWSKRTGVALIPDMLIVSDPAAELDRVLDKRFHELAVDLVVMASHVPGFRDYVFSSKAGFLASHTDLSVLVVR